MGRPEFLSLPRPYRLLCRISVGVPPEPKGGIGLHKFVKLQPMPLARIQPGPADDLVHFLGFVHVAQGNFWVGWIVAADVDISDAKHPLAHTLLEIDVLDANQLKILRWLKTLT